MIRQLGSFLAAAAVVTLPAFAAQAAGDAAAGKAKYDMFCATCHGPAGKGDGPAAPKDPVPRDFSKGEFKYDADKDGKAGSDADLTLIIKNGAAAYGGSPLMVGWGAALQEADVTNIIAFVRSLKQ
jgi:mono/diheme cytochrome c family protein